MPETKNWDEMLKDLWALEKETLGALSRCQAQQNSLINLEGELRRILTHISISRARMLNAMELSSEIVIQG